jgi:hypothetical protein
MKTIGNLLGKEGINAATVVALSGTLVVLLAKADGAVSLKRMLAGVLSNPVPQRVPTSASVSGASSLPPNRMRVTIARGPVSPAPLGERR